MEAPLSSVFGLWALYSTDSYRHDSCRGLVARSPSVWNKQSNEFWPVTKLVVGCCGLSMAILAHFNAYLI